MNRMLQQSRIILMAVCLLIAAPLFGLDGTWTLNANGAWNNTANWSSGVIADGAGYTAYLTTPITANRQLQVTAAQTIGNITVNDSDATPNQYQIVDSGASLTIAGANPLISCTTRLDLNTAAQGNQGFTKLGPGILNLGTIAKSISGPVNLYQGSQIILNHMQALMNADVTVTGTIVNSQKYQLNAKSITVGQDGKVNMLVTDNTTIPVAVIVKDSITVNSGGTLGAGIGTPTDGDPFNLLCPSITVNSGGSIIYNYVNTTATAQPGIGGSNITVNSDGQIQLAKDNITLVINNPLTLAGDGIWFNMGALHTIGNSINVTNNGPITLTGNARIGQYGIWGNMYMNQPVSGTGDLSWYIQSGYGPKFFYFYAQNTYSGKTLLGSAYALPTYIAGVHQAFPNTALEVSLVENGTLPAYYDLVTYTQAVASLKVDMVNSPSLEITGSTGAGLYVGGAMDFNSGTTIIKVPVNAHNQACQVNGGATMTLTNATMDLRSWGQFRPLWSGSGTATANIMNGGMVQCYSVRLAEGTGTPVVNVNTGGELNFADMYDGNGTPTSGRVNIDGGTLSDSSVAFTQTNWIYKVTPAKDWAVEIKAGGATFNVANQYRAVLVPIIGSAGGDLIKTGSQTLALETAPTFNGDINVQQGELRVNCDLSGMAGSVTLAAGTKLGGTGTLGAMTIPAGATIAPGNSIGTQTLASATFATASVYEWEVNGASADLLDVTGLLNISAGMVTVKVFGTTTALTITNKVFAYGSLSGSTSDLVLDLSATSYSSGTFMTEANSISLVLVPEPATLGLLGAVALLLIRKAR